MIGFMVYMLISAYLLFCVLVPIICLLFGDRMHSFEVLPKFLMHTNNKKCKDGVSCGCGDFPITDLIYFKYLCISICNVIMCPLYIPVVIKYMIMRSVAIIRSQKFTKITINYDKKILTKLCMYYNYGDRWITSSDKNIQFYKDKPFANDSYPPRYKTFRSISNIQMANLPTKLQYMPIKISDCIVEMCMSNYEESKTLCKRLLDKSNYEEIFKCKASDYSDIIKFINK